MGTGISDGWTSHRRALLACMVNVDYEAQTVKVVDISALPKTADEHLKVVESAIEYCEKHLGVDIIGWVSDAGGESRAMRVRLGRKNPRLIILDCYAHQVNLILSDLFKLKIELVDAGSDAQLVVKWFLSHTRALALLQGQQTKAGGREHRYTLANLTRWTTHYHSIQSLVDDQGPMQATVALYRKELEQIGSRKPAVTAKVLNTVCQPNFWAKITELVTYLRPLAIAINVTQAADTRLDHVLLTLANLYRLFDVHGIDPLVRQCILASLELRWSKADQQVFILAVFLNPYIRGLLFNPHNPAFCVNGLYTIVKRVFERVFEVSADSGLFEGLVDYFHWRNEFSREAWHLEEYATMYRHENKPVNLVALWSSLPYPGSTNTGRNQLACLAKRLLSVVANSAGAERLFSRMGNIHSKRRNRMHYDKVHDLATVAMDLEAQHRAAGHVHKRARRQLDSTSAQPTTALNAVGGVDDAEPNSNPSDSGSEASDDEAADDEALVDFKTLAARLAEVVDDDEDELDASAEADGLPATDDLVAQLAQQPRVRLFFGTARPIPLRELFNFSDAVEGVEDGLGVFWKGGIVNLGKEREIFEAISSEHVVNEAN